jgi:hypothetical protein
MLEEAVPQALGNTVWAVSELRQQCSWQPQVDQRVWQKLLGEQQLRRMADSDNSQHVANALLGLARLSSPAAKAACASSVIGLEYAQQCAVQLLQGRLAQQLDKWKAQHICNTMWVCGKVGVSDAAFFKRAAAASRKWLHKAAWANVMQLGYACRVLQLTDEKLMAGIVKRSQQLQQQRDEQRTSTSGVAAAVSYAVATLDMQQLASDATTLVANCGVTADTQLLPGDAGMLWQVHAWLVQHQLLDGQGLAGLLSQQQLEQGRVAAEAHHTQEQQQQQLATVASTL